MNLDESDSYKKAIEKNTRQRKVVMLSIAFCAVLVALLFFLIVTIKYKDSQTMKLFINGTQITIPRGFFMGEGEDKKYIDVRTLSSILGYEYTKGEYNKYNEDASPHRFCLTPHKSVGIC